MALAVVIQNQARRDNVAPFCAHAVSSQVLNASLQGVSPLEKLDWVKRRLEDIFVRKICTKASTYNVFSSTVMHTEQDSSL